MKPSLQLQIGTQLTMTPQLQQAIRLLQLSTLELQQEIQQTIDSNPLLEISDDQDDAPQESIDRDDSIIDLTEPSQPVELEAQQDIPEDLPVDSVWDDVFSGTSGTGLAAPTSEDEDNLLETRNAQIATLHDDLLWQLNLTPFSDSDRQIAEAILDGINELGYLQISHDDIRSALAAQDIAELPEDPEIDAVLHRIQQFDPPGIAARDLRECLMIQIRQWPDRSPIKPMALELVGSWLDLLAQRDFSSLMRRMKISEDQLRVLIKEIQALNPRPGAQLAYQRDNEYVPPDVIVRKKNERWVVELNPDIAPKLRINQQYASMIRRADSSSDNNYIKNNLQEARWFIKSLQSRHETLLKVAHCIVEHQRGFLEEGPEKMKPLVLRDIAEEVDMHESTISRVTTQKFMLTPRGLFELKYFFSSHVATNSGGECSSTAIRAMIRKLVSQEDPRKPLSDNKIADLLEAQGISVARRTIAKYRESMNIAPSSERKRLL